MLTLKQLLYEGVLLDFAKKQTIEIPKQIEDLEKKFDEMDDKSLPTAYIQQQLKSLRSDLELYKKFIESQIV